MEIQEPCEEIKPFKSKDKNYDLSSFTIDELSPEAKSKLPNGHRIPMGMLSTAGTFYLLIKHEPKLINYISRDANELVPSKNKISASGFYITIQTNGFVLGDLRYRLERVKINIWGRNEEQRRKGVNIVTAALTERPRKYLHKARLSGLLEESKSGLVYQSLTGHYKTLIKEHEVL